MADRIIYIASRFPKLGSSVTKTFQNEVTDARFRRTEYFKDTYFNSQASTNTISNKLDGFIYTIHHHNLDAIKIRKASDKSKRVEVIDFLEGLRESLSSTLKSGKLKVVVTDEIKKDVKKALDKGIITKSNIITPEIMEKKQVNLQPTFDDIDFEDDNVNSLKDLRKEAKKAEEEKTTSSKK